MAQSLRAAIAGVDSGDWVDPSGETRDVVVRLVPEARVRPGDLERLPLVTGAAPGGTPALVPLGQVARIHETVGPAQINHLNREKVINIKANVQGRSLSEVMADVRARLDQVRLPPGYVLGEGGEARDQAEVFGRVFLALRMAFLATIPISRMTPMRLMMLSVSPVTSSANTTPMSDSGSETRMASGSRNEPNWMTRMRYISSTAMISAVKMRVKTSA